MFPLLPWPPGSSQLSVTKVMLSLGFLVSPFFCTVLAALEVYFNSSVHMKFLIKQLLILLEHGHDVICRLRHAL